MILNEKQEKEFLDFYKAYYWDTSKDTGTGEIPKICKEHEDLHINLRKEEIDKILWSKKHHKYTHRWGRVEEYRDMVFNWLWLQFWPTVVDEPYKQLWVEVWWWIDWIAFYQDQFWNRYSRWWSPIMRDEVCSFNHICKVEQVDEYEYKVLSKRDDSLKNV